MENTYSATQDPSDFLFDRVVRQKWGDPGDIIDIEYIDIPIVTNRFIAQCPTDTNCTFVNYFIPFSALLKKAIINDRVGNVVEYSYDLENRLLIKEVFTGRANPAQPTTETSNRPSNPLRPDDPLSFKTTYLWNVESRQNRTIYPNGNSILNVYESDLNPNAPLKSVSYSNNS